MEKKPEEIMAIVLDYCHHACPEIGKNVPLYEGAYLKKDIDGYGIYHYWGSDRGNATCICTVPTRSTFIANPNVFTAFYKLLGLDKMDALEAERVFWTASTDSLTKSLEAEKVKNANGGEFKDMLQQVLNHSNRPEMDDAQFRMFARENINHLLYGNKEGKKDEN